MMLVALLAALCCVPDSTETHAGSHWSQDGNDYYYDALHPEDSLPDFISNSHHLVVNEGDPVRMPCAVHNLGEFSVTWRRGVQILWILQNKSEGPLIQDVLRDPRVRLNGTSLSVEAAQGKDTGEYTCELSTQPPRALHHSLTVRVPPSVRLANNRSVLTVKMSHSISLVCHASGNPTPTVTWSFKGRKLTQGASGNDLRVMNARPEDNGVYKCTADNGARRVATAAVTLQVLYPPKVRAERKEVISGVTYDATLACIVQGLPMPRVTWYRVGDVPVDPFRLIRARDARNRYLLKFDVVTLEDFGDYTCNATNYMGNSSSLIRLSGRPTPVGYSSPTRGDKNTTYTLVWEVQSYAPVLSYTITYRNDTDAEEEWVRLRVPGTTSSSPFHSSSHTFDELHPGATYHVQVAARNEFGESDVNETFSFTTLPAADAASPGGDQATGGRLPSPLPSHQPQDIVSEVDEAGEPPEVFPTSGADTAEIQDGTRGNLTQEETPAQRQELPTAESSAVAVQDSASSTLTPAERRVQTAAFLTAIILSCFFS